MTTPVVQISDVLGQPAGSLRAPEPTSGYALLFDICRELQAVEDSLDEVLELIVGKTVEILGSDVAWLMLREETGDTLRVAAACGMRDPGFTTLETPAGASLTGDPAAAQRTVVVNHYGRRAREAPEPIRTTMGAEGIRSLVCAPMLLGDVLVGALYAGIRGDARFGSAHVAMMSTLAEHGSIAIDNARLLRKLASQNDVLEQSFAIHRQVTAVGLRDGGEDGVVPTLARVLGRRIAVEPDATSGLTSCIDSDPTAPPGDEPAGRALMLAGETPLGEIVAYGAPLSELEQSALEHGATVLTAELLRQRTAREAEWRLQGELLEELVDAPGPLPESLRLRASHVGVDLARARQVITLETDGFPAVERRLLSAARALAGRYAFGLDAGPALAFQRGSRIVLAVPAADALNPLRLAAQLEDEVTKLGTTARVGISRPTTDLGPASREANACAQLAALSGFADGRVVAAAALAPFDSLFDADTSEQADAMTREYLGALARHDRGGRVPLLETVQAFVEAGGHTARAAQRCFVHVTTLKYRLGLAAEHVHGPLDRLDVRFELRIAFKTLAVLEALGGDPLGRRAHDALADQAASA